MASVLPPIEVPSENAGQRDLTGWLLNQRYCLLGVLGRGGMATVYRASDTKNEREVAVKVLDPAPMDPVHRERFLRESRLSAQLSHESIVRVFDTGESDGLCFIAMELLQGRTLAQVLVNERVLRWTRALELTRKVGAGLAFAHLKGLVHRDLKPANCFVVGAGLSEGLKILDFGLAKPVIALAGDPEVTRNAEVLGSPTYMAPEQARGVAAVQTDIYAVGVMLFRMLAGRPPFLGNSPVDVIIQHMQAPVPWLREVPSSTEVPIELELVMRRCLEKDPVARYASVEVLAAALEEAEVKALEGASRSRTGPHRAPLPPPLPPPPLPRPASAATGRLPPSPPSPTPPVLHPTPMPKWLFGRLRTSRWAWLMATVATVATMTAAASFTIGAIASRQGPGASGQGPGASEQGPGASEQGPGASEQGPGASEQGPGASEQGPGASVPQRATEEGRATSPGLEPPAAVALEPPTAPTDSPTTPAPEVSPARSPPRAGEGTSLPKIAADGAPHAPRATLKAKVGARAPRGSLGGAASSASPPSPQPQAPASDEGYKDDPYE